MISVIIPSLMLFAQPTINVNCSVDGVFEEVNDFSVTEIYKYSSEQKEVFGYHFYSGDYGVSDYDEYLNINFSLGQYGNIPLYIKTGTPQRNNPGLNGNVYWNELYLTFNTNEDHSGDVYYSNFYLSNFYAVADDSMERHRLPDVYFNGFWDIMDSNNDGTFGFDSLNSDHWHIEFDMVIFPYDMINESGSYVIGYEQGYQVGWNSQEVNVSNAYSDGYNDGYEEAYQSNSTVTSIFSGILQVAMVPVNFFLAIFNFEILGINLSGFIRALFTIAITIIVVKAVMGGKGASED